MNIKKALLWITKLFTVDLLSAGVDTRYAAEINQCGGGVNWEANYKSANKQINDLLLRLRDRKEKLDAAAKKFRQLESLMKSTDHMLCDKVTKGREIALEGWREINNI